MARRAEPKGRAAEQPVGGKEEPVEDWDLEALDQKIAKGPWHYMKAAEYLGLKSVGRRFARDPETKPFNDEAFHVSLPSLQSFSLKAAQYTIAFKGR